MEQSGGIDITDYSFVKEWVCAQTVPKEMTTESSLSLYCASWNVGGASGGFTKTAYPSSLHTWVGIEKTDIVAIGLQEIVDVNGAGNLIIEHDGSQIWMEMLGERLGVDYTVVVSKHYVGVWLGVWVRKELLPFISGVSVDTVGVGLLGVAGNKGAVVARMLVHNRSICFVSAHFAAHEQFVNERNANYASIRSRIKMKTSDLGFSNPKRLFRDDDYVTISEHELEFWLGDFNYRLYDIATDDALALASGDGWKELLPHDQLADEMKHNRVFQGLSEAQIDFPPTYKFVPGTRVYDTRNEKKIRVPSWCDRVIYRNVEGLTVTRYMSAPEETLSDHKPVFSVINFPVMSCNLDTLTEYHTSLTKQLKNECMAAWLERHPEVPVTARRMELAHLLAMAEPNPTLPEALFILYCPSGSSISVSRLRDLVYDVLLCAGQPLLLPDACMLQLFKHFRATHSPVLSPLSYSEWSSRFVSLAHVIRVVQQPLLEAHCRPDDGVMFTGLPRGGTLLASIAELFGAISKTFVCECPDASDREIAVVFFVDEDSREQALATGSLGCTLDGYPLKVSPLQGRFPRPSTDPVEAAVKSAMIWGRSIAAMFE